MASVWRDLADSMPFRQPEWLLSWWDNYRDESMELMVAIVRDDEDRVRALAPWYLHKPSRTIRFLGDGKVCTDHTTILTAPQFYDESALHQIAQYLVKESKAWKVLHLEAVSTADPILASFQTAMLRQGCRCQARLVANTWQVDQPDGWEAFLEGLSKNSRKMFRKRSSDLEKTRIRWVHDKSDLNDFLPILTDLHQRRRRALGDDGCFADPRFTQFLATASQRLLDRNQLQAFSIWLDGQPIAADIGFRSKDRWLCYQAGIDPEKMEHEPGKLANIHILKNAERFGIHTIDFLRGDEPYKQQLKANPHAVHDLRFTRPGFQGQATQWSWKAREVLKSFANRYRRKK
jgi:CelD/BcsL family acetyltransferase involved in cellulose biosynthesis